MLFLPFMVNASSVKAYYGDYCYTILLHNNTCWFSYPPNNYPDYSGDIVVPSTIEYRGESYKVTKIEMLACAMYENVTSVVISEGIEEIQNSAFEDCANLQLVHIPSTVTHIGPWVFRGTGLKKIICDATDIPETDDRAFENINLGEVTLIVPPSAIDAYKASPIWGKFSFGQ